jgi:hypothetical protein
MHPKSDQTYLGSPKTDHSRFGPFCHGSIIVHQFALCKSTQVGQEVFSHGASISTVIKCIFDVHADVVCWVRSAVEGEGNDGIQSVSEKRVDVIVRQLNSATFIDRFGQSAKTFGTYPVRLLSSNLSNGSPQRIQ